VKSKGKTAKKQGNAKNGAGRGGAVAKSASKKSEHRNGAGKNAANVSVTGALDSSGRGITAGSASSGQSRGRGQAWVAEKLGVDQSRISRLSKLSWWRWGPEYCDDDVAAIAAERERRKSSPSKEREERRLIRARRLNSEFDLKVKEGKYQKREDVEEGRVARILAVKTKLLELPARSAQLVGKTDQQIAADLKVWAKELCDVFASAA
jgi:hypothetical protein